MTLGWFSGDRNPEGAGGGPHHCLPLPLVHSRLRSRAACNAGRRISPKQCLGDEGDGSRKGDGDGWKPRAAQRQTAIYQIPARRSGERVFAATDCGCSFIPKRAW